MREEPNPTERVTGPSAVILSAGNERPREAIVLGSTVVMILDDTVAGSDLYAGFNILEPGAVISTHWHRVSEFQFILTGSGLAMLNGGLETPIGPHDVLFAPAGRSGAHGFRNTGSTPLTILFAYPTPDGGRPDYQSLDSE